MVASQLKANATSGFASEMPHDTGKRAPRGPPLAKTGPYVAPRLAGSPASSPDLGRKMPATGRVHTLTPKGESPSPVKGPASSNATPRSGPRKIRPDTTPNSTPGATPTSSRPLSMVSARDPSPDKYPSPSGIGIHGVGLNGRSRPGSMVGSGGAATYLRNLSPERHVPKPQNAASPQAMFFHANDAPIVAPKPIAPVAAPPKAQPFFYANREQSPQVSVPDPQPHPALQSQAKFFHANGLREGEKPLNRGTHSPSSSASNIRSAPKLAQYAGPARSVTTRSPSPLKEFDTPIQRSQPSSKSTVSTLANVPTALVAASKSRPLSAESPLNSNRRGSINSSLSIQHKKSQSINTTDSSEAFRSHLGLESIGRISDASSSFVSEPESLESGPVLSDVATFPPMSPTSPLASPSHSAIGVSSIDPSQPSKLEQAQALAAQARRERKVLDLEISNSSLLAINRTLEREMRKQKVELRRYRRLTSSGRISLPGLISGDGRPSTANTNSSGLSPIEGSDEEALNSSDEDDEDLSSIASTPTTDSPRSPDDNTEAAARRRERDAKRLRLDLARHRALLEDSQALNQSLKRCLGRTEALISEGKRALQHKVRISEVHIGGRVLDADEVGDDVELDERRRGLLSPSIERTAGDGSEYRWEEASAAGENGDLASPQSPFSGVVPFVRPTSLDNATLPGASWLDGTASPAPAWSPVRSTATPARSPPRQSPTRADALTRPALTVATSRLH